MSKCASDEDMSSCIETSAGACYMYGAVVLVAVKLHEVGQVLGAPDLLACTSIGCRCSTQKQSRYTSESPCNGQRHAVGWASTHPARHKGCPGHRFLPAINITSSSDTSTSASVAATQEVNNLCGVVEDDHGPDVCGQGRDGSEGALVGFVKYCYVDAEIIQRI